MDPETAARRWRDTWRRGWERKDADAVASLFAGGARFRSEPFRRHQDPRAYAKWAFEEQDEAECRFADPVVAGDRAFCEYWSVVTFGGRVETIAGVALIRFREDGLVVDQRDYWSTREGRHEPPEGWGS